ncbi:MAG TPA: hypothetical protein VJ772_03585 [Nitrososphaeraceae archaeon]|nr:hypothetical protein [Nitrososphaeraceae archaeon]
MRVFEDHTTKQVVIIIILSWVLIGLVVAFWNDTTKYMLLALLIPTGVLIKIRLDENKIKQ